MRHQVGLHYYFSKGNFVPLNRGGLIEEEEDS
jgi:hypothetical protein